MEMYAALKIEMTYQSRKYESMYTSEGNERSNERDEIIKKMNNVIIHGLEEISTQNDIDEAVAINRAIGNHSFSQYNIIKIGRIGVISENKSRPLKIELDSRVSKINMMRNAKHLVSLQHYANISIQHDLTKRQVHELKKIKEEARYQEGCNAEGTFRYSVRGPPGRWTIVKLPKN